MIEWSKILKADCCNHGEKSMNYAKILKANPYRDAQGRFSSKDSDSGTPQIPSKALEHITPVITGGEAVDRAKASILAGKDVGPIQLIKLPSGELLLQDGNHRLQAMRELGLKKIPVQVLSVDSNFKFTDISAEYKK